MTIKDIKQILIGSLKDEWITIDDPKSWTKDIKEAQGREELQEVVSDMQDFVKNDPMNVLFDMYYELEN